MQFSKDNPFCAKLIRKERLTAADSYKDTHFLVFDISGSGIIYECGDVLAILPKNDEREISEIIEILKIDENSNVVFENKQQRVKSVLTENVCVTHLSKKFLQFFAENLSNDVEKNAILEKIKDSELCDSFSKSHNLLKLLKEFKSITIDAQNLINNLRVISPRLYSIASSYKKNNNEIGLLVGSVWFEHDDGFIKLGVASNYMNKRLKVGDSAKIYVMPSHFKLPENAQSDIILVGPGTGFAPFVSFIEEREWQMKSGEKVGKTWLFFGEQHIEKEFYLKDRVLDWEKNGVLDRLDLAFSRDQEQKIYVQDKIYENRNDIYNWISNGAYFYVCGDAKRMAADVNSMLLKIISEVGNKTEDESSEFLKILKKDKRYQRDVY